MAWHCHAATTIYWYYNTIATSNNHVLFNLMAWPAIAAVSFSVRHRCCLHKIHFKLKIWYFYACVLSQRFIICIQKYFQFFFAILFIYEFLQTCFCLWRLKKFLHCCCYYSCGRFALKLHCTWYLQAALLKITYSSSSKLLYSASWDFA